MVNSAETTYRSIKGIQSKIYQLKPEIERENEWLKELLKRPVDSSGLQYAKQPSDLRDEQLHTPIKEKSGDLLEGLSGRKPFHLLFTTERVDKDQRDSFELDMQYQQYLYHGGKQLFKVQKRPPDSALKVQISPLKVGLDSQPSRSQDSQAEDHSYYQLGEDQEESPRLTGRMDVPMDVLRPIDEKFGKVRTGKKSFQGRHKSGRKRSNSEIVAESSG